MPQVNCHSRVICTCLPISSSECFLRTAVLTAHCECEPEKTAHSSESGVPTHKSSNRESMLMCITWNKCGPVFGGCYNHLSLILRLSVGCPKEPVYEASVT